MIIKDLLFKIKEDLKRLFIYPTIFWGTDGKVDYDYYWHKRRGKNNDFSLSHWQKTRADLVLNFLSDGDVVVDIGGGEGAMLKYFKDHKNIAGVCVDDNELVLDQAQKKNLKVIKTDLSVPENWSQIPECDFITGFEILEHLPNPEHFILSLSGRVRKGMIFSFPNTGYYLHRLRLLFGKFPLQWITHPGEHLRFWTVSDVKYWVNALNFKMENLILYEGVPILNKIIPSLFGQGIIIHISKEK